MLKLSCVITISFSSFAAGALVVAGALVGCGLLAATGALVAGFPLG
jgi:hypothetical protein